MSAADPIRAALLAVNYVGTAGELVLEIEGVFFRVNVQGREGEARIAAVHKFMARRTAALALLDEETRWSIRERPEDCDRKEG